jgi:hypothetical protein
MMVFAFLMNEVKAGLLPQGHLLAVSGYALEYHAAFSKRRAQIQGCAATQNQLACRC